ncbi:MAG: septum formation protein Maf [Bacteroidaceae bacterium]|nr:septum formation protein Maf [Bacteroidaceae bacterium]
MLQNLSKYDLILASASPRRRELLGQLGVPFRVKTLAGIDESFPEGLTPEATAAHISRAKARAYEPLLDERTLIVTADTIVWSDGRVLGKPADEADARRMLRLLAAKTHQVVTGVTVATRRRTETIAVSTDVTFAPLTDDEIAYYVATYRPLDKAGAYGIQEWIGMAAVESISGSYWNVMGLPVHQLYKLLKTF